jgi:transcriptional antiterminator RfaH
MWYAIYTKSGREDSITSRLRNTGIEVLNPKIRLKKFSRGRYALISEPLFPCYLFADFERSKYAHLITYTRGVRYIVGKANPVEVSEDIIKGIKDNTGDEDMVVIRPRQFNKGDRVSIRQGPFSNFYGVFEREVRGPERVLILLEALNCKIEIDNCFL